MEFEIQYVLINDLGTYEGEIMIVNEEQLVNIIELSKTFYNGGFELNCIDDSFIVFPPDIVRRSILKINKKLISDV